MGTAGTASTQVPSASNSFSVVLIFINLDFELFTRLVLSGAIRDALVVFGILPVAAADLVPITYFQGSVNALVAVNSKSAQNSIVDQQESIVNHALSAYLLATTGESSGGDTNTTAATTTANVTVTQIGEATENSGAGAAGEAVDSSQAWLVPLV